MPSRNVYFVLIFVFISLFFASKTSFREQILRNVARELKLRSFESPSQDALFEGAASGMAEAVGDAPYTAYLPPAETDEYLNEIQGKFAGIGVRNLLKDRESGEFYFTPMRSTPASNAGLKLGDRIVAVDGTDVAQLSVSELTELLRGKEKTSVRLKIRSRSSIPAFAAASANGAPLESNGSTDATSDSASDETANAATPTNEPAVSVSSSTDAKDGGSNASSAPDVFRDVELTREIVQQDVVSGDRLDANGNWIYTLNDDPTIGYIAIEQFADATATQTKAALETLEQTGVSSVILDFRGNPGGFLPDAIEISDEFVPVGAKIVETRDRNGDVETVYRATSRPKKSFRVVVLVDGDSASASEIVSAALQDANVAVVGGERSYGKGTIQSLFELPCNLGLLRMTTAGFWRPSGLPIHRRRDASDSDVWGVSPTPELALPLSDAEKFYRLWIRYLRISTPENGELDAKTLAFTVEQTRDVLRLIDQKSEELARFEAFREFRAEIDGASDSSSSAKTPSIETPSAAKDDEKNVDAKPFEPSGRAPRFDPQLDRAVDYLNGFRQTNPF